MENYKLGKKWLNSIRKRADIKPDISLIGDYFVNVTSKAALNMMTKSLAHVLGPEIRINTVAPGPIKTRWLKGGMGDEAYSALIEQAE